MIHLIIKVGIDVEESGLNRDEIKQDIVQFTKNLLICGAEDQGIGLVLEGVDIGEEKIRKKMRKLEKRIKKLEKERANTDREPSAPKEKETQLKYYCTKKELKEWRRKSK